MTTWSIYRNSRNEFLLHRAGFSWLAVFLSPVWALSRRLYKTSLLLAVLGPICWSGLEKALSHAGSPLARSLLSLLFLVAWGLLAGHYANRWHRYVLEREGCALTASEMPESAPSAKR